MKNLTLERTFSAPIEKVWEALTSEEKLRKWWAPAGMETSSLSVDFKLGGIFAYCFKAPAGKEFWGRGIYKSVEEPKYLSWLDTFTDPQGNPVAASYYGMPGKEIIETLVEFKLSHANGTTTMTMVAENPYDDTMKEDMTSGWESMFDKLEALLKS